MSILDAIKVQKANQRSIQELAMLPQDEIIRMAQMGDIPADVVPVVISEKARQAQQKAAQEAASKGPQQTVMDQAMQVNARDEQGLPAVAPAQQPSQGAQGLPQAAPPQSAPQPPQQPQQPQQQPGQAPAQGMAAGGVTGLPTRGMFRDKNFQGGGIVALAGGGSDFTSDTDPSTFTAGIRPEESNEPISNRGLSALIDQQEESVSAPVSGRRPPSLAEAIGMAQKYRAPYSELSEAEKEYGKARSLSAEDVKQNQWMRMLQAGLGIMGGESPYALSNIGKGSQEALKGYAEDVKDQRAMKMGDLKRAAEIAKSQREAGLAGVHEGVGIYGKELEHDYHLAGKTTTTDFQRRYNNFLPTAMEIYKTKDPTDPRVMAKATQMADESAGLAAQKLVAQRDIAAGAQGVQQFGIDSTRWNSASKEVNDAIENQPSGALAREYRRLSKIDRENSKAGTPSNLAEDYKTKQILHTYESMPGSRPSMGGAPPVKTPSPSVQKPAALPMPASGNKAELKDGAVYETGFGRARWNAKTEKFKLED